MKPPSLLLLRPFRFKYSPQHPVPLIYVLPLKSESMFYTHIKQEKWYQGYCTYTSMQVRYVSTKALASVNSVHDVPVMTHFYGDGFTDNQ
jgi:hypothetical protein